MQATPPSVNHEKVSHALLEIKVYPFLILLNSGFAFWDLTLK